MRVDELFDIEICKNPISREYADENKGTTAYITTTSENNGIDGYVNYPAQYQGNVITVSKDGASADAFYQTEPFCGNEKVMVLIPKFDLTPIQMMFYTYAISFNKERFAYGRKCSVERLSELDVPAIEDIPDWIDDFEIKPLTTKNKKGKVPELNIQKWKEFKISDIFDVKYGVNLELNACTECDAKDSNAVNFVARTAENNGISAHVLRINDVTPQKAGLISVAGGGSVLSTFLQPEPFYSGRDLYTLASKDDISDAAKMFIITIIEQNKYKYSYGRQANKTLPDLILKLPVDDKGNPNYSFMENYIKSLPYGDRLEG